MDLQRIAPLSPKKLAVLLQIGAVGLERVARQPSLELEVGEEVERQLGQMAGGGGGLGGDHALSCSGLPGAILRLSRARTIACELADPRGYRAAAAAVSSRTSRRPGPSPGRTGAQAGPGGVSGGAGPGGLGGAQTDRRRASHSSAISDFESRDSAIASSRR